MTSRLDRLFILLESGSSAITRRAAAKQIGEVQRLHPHELHNLLNRLVNYLHSTSWDTRIAAAQAVEAILKNVPKWNPKCMGCGTISVKKEEEAVVHIDEGGNTIEKNDDATTANCGDKSRLSFKNFNLEKILEHGARLMGSEGTEFDFQQDNEENTKDVLLKQRALLSEKFGLNNSTNLGFTLDDLVTLDDMKTTTNEAAQINLKMESKKLLSVQEMLNSCDKNSMSSGTSSCTTSICATASSSLSCREKNRAKRKARQNNNYGGNSSTSTSTCVTPTTTLSRANSFSDVVFEPDVKRVKTEQAITETPTVISDPVPDATGTWNDTNEWPFETFCSKLYIDLLSPRWETRHGAATALRELINSHADTAGKSIYCTAVENDLRHQLWMEDVTLRLLCVLALDRFGDFVSDQVVAPVRETCAQVLGAVLKQMHAENVEKTIEILIMLTRQKDWEVRHGGLLGVKYLLVVREDLLTVLLPLIIKDILAGLFDAVDDVGAVAASTLIPIAAWLPKLLSTAEVSNIVKMLWDLLLEQDELTSACNSFMGLLSSILCLPNASTSIQMEPMAKLIPRLWPFLSHSSSSVRKSTLKTLLTLTQPIYEPAAAGSLGASCGGENGSATKSTNGGQMTINHGVRDWPTELLQESLRQVYQRVLVEHIEDIQDVAVKVWNNLVAYGELSALLHATCPRISSWLCLAMQPARLAFDPNTLVYPRLVPQQIKEGNHVKPLQKLYLGGTETTPLDVREKNVIRARCKASKMLGLLSKYIVLRDPGIVYTDDIESPIDQYTTLLVSYLNSRSALQRLISSMVIANWAIYDHTILPGPAQLQLKLINCLNEYIYYDEVALIFTRLLQESRDFIATLKQHKIILPELEHLNVLSLDQIQMLSTTMTDNLRAKYSLKPKIVEVLEDRRKCLQNAHMTTSNEQNGLNISVQSALAGSVVCLQCLPDKLNPVIKPLMESIKREECQILQKLSATYLVLLLDQISNRTPCPNNKIVSNVCHLLKSDAEFTPRILPVEKTMRQMDSKNVQATNPYHGILTLVNRQRSQEVMNGGSVGRGPGRPPAIDVQIDQPIESEDPNRKLNQIQRIGATFVVTTICTHFGDQLKVKICVLWELMIDHILKTVTEDRVHQLQDEIINEGETTSLVISLQLIEVAAEHVHASLQEDLFVLLPHLCLLLGHPFKAIRHLTSRCLAVLATINNQRVMDLVIERIIPYLGSIEQLIWRQGAAESIACIVNKLQYNIVPYVVLLVVPLLGRMSDQDISVRLMSTQCFATLVQLMPLDGNTPDLPELSGRLKARKEIDRKFLDYLFTPKKIPDYKVPVPISAELRSYQQAGINWLWFLNKYKLHGILCDDMGLGKTLQTICILAGDHYQRNIEKMPVLPSIVICPPTLTGHWVFEVGKFLPNNFLKPLHYVGLPVDREKLRHKLSRHNLVVASYDIVRKDIEFFGSILWNYCVLDEGHIIKNGKTKSSKAIKTLIANHRLILSGTPIQNNVLELWSLFDFLMPGFLGTEKQFILKFSRPILASRDAKSSPKDQEAGALAMEALHRQVLPFLLRRVKEDVLTDLPPKITQDLLCELSPLQEKLYEDLSKTQLNDDIRNCLENIEQHKMNKTHVFQALRYLQNVCNHPKLVLKAHHPEFQSIQKELAQSNSCLDDIDHSGKLPALKQLLLDCGIGVEDDISVNQHRALIFCQLKAMLDIIENDLLRRHLPAVSYLRLDGSVPASSRHDIVRKFNSDPSIDVLLLTTQVGGLGLNLTGADTVIFVEHDWNPMKDLQAMDRAHRIGQKKVVNVYRLITRKSLEEKIMGLQKFKLMTAHTIVNDENAAMETMGTDQILDLFNLDNEKGTGGSSGGGGGGGNHSGRGGLASTGGTSMKNVLENLPELWDDRQYEEEYDLSQFLEKLK